MMKPSESRFKSSLVLSTALVPWLLAAGPALAQGGAASNEGIETILVTANKRTENIQKVPIAISAVTAATAERTGLVNGESLMALVPGLTMDRQTNGSTPFLRGVGSPSTQVGTEPAVATYVDDVYYISSAAGLLNYNSIDNIQVLKGPQGTLFGRNATGGVINIYTKDPTEDPRLDVSVGYGKYADVTGSIYASGRIAKDLSANLSLYGQKQNKGWGKNFTTGNPTYLSSDYGARMKFLWTPGDSTRILWNSDFDIFHNQQAVYFRAAPGTTSNAGACCGPAPGLYDTFENLDPVAAVNRYGTSLKIDHDFGAFKIRNIASYAQIRAQQKFSQDNNPSFRLNPFLVYRTKTYTEEFQLLAPDESPLKWVVGFFYLHDDSFVDPSTFEGSLAQLVTSIPGNANRKGSRAHQATDSYAGFGQATAAILPSTNLTAGLRYTVDMRTIDGGRINRDGLGNDGPFVPNSNSGASAKWSALTGRISIDHQVTDNFMVYAAYTNGFKSGVFNLIIAPDFGNAVPTVADFEDPAAPEKIDAYTAGFKSDLLDRRLRINAEAFYYKYSNLQLQQVVLVPGGGTVTKITNAASATMYGLDIEITAKPTQYLTLSAGIGIESGKYDNYPNGQFAIYGATPSGGGNCSLTPTSPCAISTGVFPPNYDPTTGNWNLKGNHTVHTPPLQVSLTGDYLIPTSVGEFDIALNWFHSGNYFFDPDNGQGQRPPSSSQNNRQAPYDIINGAITWTSPDSRWETRLWAKNLTNETYYNFMNETGTITKKTPAAPRTFGVVFSAHL